jgi:hypothetical protein
VLDEPGSSQVRREHAAQFGFPTEVVSAVKSRAGPAQDLATLVRKIIVIPIAFALALGIVSCGTEEIAQVDAEFELRERAQIDAAITDLEALQADPGRAQSARESIGRYLRARREAKRFNKEVELQGGDGNPQGLPAVVADDQVLDTARGVVPSLFGPSGNTVVPEDLRRFRGAAADEPARALRPVVVGPVELLTARARLYGLDSTYPDRDGLTRREVIEGAASAVAPHWPGLAAELERALGRT